jgi:hypothetical protein
MHHHAVFSEKAGYGVALGAGCILIGFAAVSREMLRVERNRKR